MRFSKGSFYSTVYKKIIKYTQCNTDSDMVSTATMEWSLIALARKIVVLMLKSQLPPPQVISFKY